MATNKNQHFVPRCYLKAFTQDGKNAAINLLNLDRERCIPGAPVKNQCSGDYFYGQDIQLEKAIQAVEAEYAAVVARIQTPGYRLTDNDRFVLRIFILFQYMRTEAASRRSVEMFGGMEVAIGHQEMEGFKPSIKEAVQTAMRIFATGMHLLDDLKVCLVCNKTSRPFVTSDNPAAMTNRWHMEDQRVQHKSPGLMSCGLTSPHAQRNVRCIRWRRAQHSTQSWLGGVAQRAGCHSFQRTSIPERSGQRLFSRMGRWRLDTQQLQHCGEPKATLPTPDQLRCFGQG